MIEEFKRISEHALLKLMHSLRVFRMRRPKRDSLRTAILSGSIRRVK